MWKSCARPSTGRQAATGRAFGDERREKRRETTRRMRPPVEQEFFCRLAAGRLSERRDLSRRAVERTITATSVLSKHRVLRERQLLVWGGQMGGWVAGTLALAAVILLLTHQGVSSSRGDQRTRFSPAARLTFALLGLGVVAY